MRAQEAGLSGLAAESPAGAVERLHRMATAYWVSKALSVAASLGLADLLADRPMTAAELAAATGCDEDRLGRLMRALVDEGIFERHADETYGLTALGQPLRGDHERSLRAFVAMVGEESYRAFDGLLEMLRGGPPAFEVEFGHRFYDHLMEHEDAAARFDGAMAERHAAVQASLASGIPAAGARSLVDVGGGDGRLAVGLLALHPELRVSILERPQVAERARATLAGAGVSDRAEVLTGDFFAEIPPGADGYLVASVIHNWEDADAVRLLRAIRAAMRTDARLWIVELVVPEDGTPSFATLLDLEVMVLMGGRERTLREHRELLRSAGLTVARVLPTGGRMTVVEAERSE